MISTKNLSMDAALLTNRERTRERIYAKTYPMVRSHLSADKHTFTVDQGPLGSY